MLVFNKDLNHCQFHGGVKEDYPKGVGRTLIPFRFPRVKFGKEDAPQAGETLSYSSLVIGGVVWLTEQSVETLQATSLLATVAKTLRHCL